MALNPMAVAARRGVVLFRILVSVSLCYMMMWSPFTDLLLVVASKSTARVVNDIYASDYEDPFEEFGDGPMLPELDVDMEVGGGFRINQEANPYDSGINSENGFENGNRFGKRTKPEDSISFGPVDKQNFWPECFAILFFITYVVNYFVGKSQNHQIAHSWLQNFKPLFQKQFSAVGLYEQDSTYTISTEDGSGFIQESQSCFKLYATGRRFCTCCLATLELRKRQDLLFLLLEMADLGPTKDLVTLEIPVHGKVFSFLGRLLGFNSFHPPLARVRCPRRRTLYITLFSLYKFTNYSCLIYVLFL